VRGKRSSDPEAGAAGDGGGGWCKSKHKRRSCWSSGESWGQVATRGWRRHTCPVGFWLTAKTQAHVKLTISGSVGWRDWSFCCRFSDN
jgi:hypothetical protein